MTRYQRAAIIFCTSVSLLYLSQTAAWATPKLSGGLHCAACHHDAFPDVLKVDVDSLNNAIVAAPGETAQLSFDVTIPASAGAGPASVSGDDREHGDDEEDDDEQHESNIEFEYILGVSGLEVPGLTPILGSLWEHRPTDSVSYVLADDYEGSRRFTLEVAVDAGMASGDYSLLAVAAGKMEMEMATGEENELKWSDSKPFILRIGSVANIPEPSTLALLLSLTASAMLVRGRR